MGWVSSFRSRNAVGAPPFWTAPPSIIGTPQDGVASSFTDGTAVNGTSFLTQWFVNGVYVGNGATYTPITADVGKSLTVDRIVINAYGTARSSSAQVTVTAATSGIAAMPPTNLDGTSPGSGQANLTWTLSEFLADGSAIGAAATGLTIYHSASAGGAMDKSGTRISPDLSAAAISTNLTGIASGVRYFAIATNVSGIEGLCGPEFRMTVS